MPFTDLLRITVLLAGAEATALALIAVLASQRDGDTTTMAVGGAWLLIATVAGLYLGRGSRAAEAVRGVLAEARTSALLPAESPGRIALKRLWPIPLSAVAAGGVGVAFPGVAAIGAGFALLVALAFRAREAAVYAVEQRDGARFYVLPGSALEPVRLMRAPGLSSDRASRP